METVSDTLVERVETLIRAQTGSHEWGSPHVAATPLSLAVQQLAVEVAQLQDAVREVAREVERISGRD